MNSCAVKISPSIRLRREYFGGLVYDKRNGTLVEIDNEAFLMLALIRNQAVDIKKLYRFLENNKLIQSSERKMQQVIRELLRLNIIEYFNETTPDVKLSVKSVTNTPYPAKWLSAPETVHWAITYQCDENCKDCYVRRFSFDKAELDTRQAIAVIDKIAKWGVFQLAIGGGEPFKRDDLLQLVQYAAEQALSVHITTGRCEIDKTNLAMLAKFIKVLQIGIQAEKLLDSNTDAYFQKIKKLVQHLHSFGIIPGANIMLSKSNILRLPLMAKKIVDCGFERIVFLRYKPPAHISRWKMEKPNAHQLIHLHKTISGIVKKHPDIHYRIDCALSFIQRDLPNDIASKLGIKGCVAADRIAAISPDGSVYPCSQLVYPECYSGNLSESDQHELWNTSQNLQNYRFFRTAHSFKQSSCGVCLKNETCGGCRVFADDLMGGDPFCPAPLLPPLKESGKFEIPTS